MFLDFSLIKKLARFSLIVPRVLTFKGLVNKKFVAFLYADGLTMVLITAQ